MKDFCQQINDGEYDGLLNYCVMGTVNGEKCVIECTMEVCIITVIKKWRQL